MIPAVPWVTEVCEENVLVEPISTSQWRVLDTRLSEHDARSLLGYIEKKTDQFVVTQLTHGFSWFCFDSLREATDHFTHEPSEEAALDDHVLSWMNRTP